MKIVTRMLMDELYESTNENGNTITVDMRKKEEKKSLSPTEQVVSALAACAAVDIVHMLRKRKKSVDAFVIESNSTRQEVPPRWLTHIHCKYIITSGDVNEEELSKVAALTQEKYCSVASSLKSEITFSAEVIRP